MILIQPIILASEFVTHTVLIVLIGIIVVEYVVQRKRIQEGVRGRVFYAVSAMTMFGAVWVFLDFFVSLKVPSILFFRYALLVGIIALVFYVARMAVTFSEIVRIPKRLGVALVAAILVFILFDVLHHTTGVPNIGVLYGLSRIVGVCTYYFFIMRYLIINDAHDDRT